MTLVEMCSHLATERAGRGTLHLTVGASELYPNLNGNGEPTDRPDLRSSGASPYSRSRNEIMYTNRGGFGSPLVRSVRRAFHRSKHLLEVLFERASRCYELPVLTHDVLVESFEQAGCAWFLRRILRSRLFLDSTIRLSWGAKPAPVREEE